MLSILNRWYLNHFSDPQAVTLLFIILSCGLLIYFAGALLAPMLIAIVLAYILNWPVEQLAKLKVNRLMGSSLMLLLFIVLIIFILVGLIPSIWTQGVALITEWPTMLNKGLIELQKYLSNYPNFIDSNSLDEKILEIRRVLDTQNLLNDTKNILNIGRSLLSYSMSIMTILVYLILVPLMVFFLLKDKIILINAIKRFIPTDSELVSKVLEEMDLQLFNYIRGKVIEIAIVGGSTYVLFAIMGLNYAVLLGVLTGLSVLIPYVGATLVTIPILLVSFFQWGLSHEFGYLMLGYGIIQGLDGNVLVPLLFSDAVDLHPIYIISAVLVFGGLWGVFGVFFAIPLASLIKAVINVWPDSTQVKVEG